MTESIKLNVRTEGLGEFYGIAPEDHERRNRPAMTIDELQEIILRILDENEPQEVEGLFILEHGIHRAYLKLQGNQLEISNPRNANYQNVRLAVEDLESTLKDFFELHAQPEPVRRSHLILLEWVIAVVVGFGMVAAFILVANHLEERKTFMPEPPHVSIEGDKEISATRDRLAGIYVTELLSGETLLEILPNGQWGFYDLEKAAGGFINAVLVEKGTCKPVVTNMGVGLLANNNYLFQSTETDVLVFQDRRYLRTGKERNDVPFLRFWD